MAAIRSAKTIANLNGQLDSSEGTTSEFSNEIICS